MKPQKDDTQAPKIPDLECECGAKFKLAGDLVVHVQMRKRAGEDNHG